MSSIVSRREFLETAARASIGAALLGEYPIVASGAEDPVERVRRFGHFNDSRPAKSGLEGAIVGAPGGDAYAASRKIVARIGDSGAGIVIADGFRKKHGFNVNIPTRGDGDYKDHTHDNDSRLVHEAYMHALGQMARAPVLFYFEVRTVPKLDMAEIQISGVSRDEAALMKMLYQNAVKKLPAREAAKVSPEARVESLDSLKTDYYGTKHHGVPIRYPRSFIAALPRVEGTEEAYATVLSNVIAESVPLLRQGIDANGQRMRQLGIQISSFGRLEYIKPISGEFKGVVIGAPHGSYDVSTAEVVRDLSNKLGIGAVVAKGFTEYETGDNRINVNRPTEGAVLKSSEENPTQRATDIYRHFERLVKQAAGDNLVVYFDVHANDYSGTQDRIEVATKGISDDEARAVREMLAGAFGKNLRNHGLSSLKVLVEPADSLSVWGATVAKRDGILGNASRGLNIKVPFFKQVKEVYTNSLIEAVPAIVYALRKS